MTTGAVSGNKGKKHVALTEGQLPECQKKLRELIDVRFAEKLQLDEHGGWEYNLTYRVRPEYLSRSVESSGLLEIFSELKTGAGFGFNMLVDVTAVDWLDTKEPRFDVIYQLLSLTYQHRLTVKVGVEEDRPAVDSVRSLWAAANFLEREVWDMFGIDFRGHGDLRRILLYDEFVGHPLRKDYPLRGKQPRVPLRFPESPNTSGLMHRDELVKLPSFKGGVSTESLSMEKVTSEGVDA